MNKTTELGLIGIIGGAVCGAILTTGAVLYNHIMDDCERRVSETRSSTWDRAWKEAFKMGKQHAYSMVDISAKWGGTCEISPNDDSTKKVKVEYVDK